MIPINRINKPYCHVPTLDMLNTIDVADRGVFELSKKEVGKTRRLIYGINRDGIVRYRTMLDGPLLLVWRLK